MNNKITYAQWEALLEVHQNSPITARITRKKAFETLLKNGLVLVVDDRVRVTDIGYEKAKEIAALYDR